MGLGHVAAPPEPDRHVRAARVAAARVEHPVVVDRHSHRDAVLLARVPAQRTGGRVQRLDPSIGVDDQLVPELAADDQRRRVGACPFTTLDLPALLSAGLVEGQQIAGGLMIAKEQQQPAIQDRRAAVPPTDVEGGVVLAEVALPQESTVEREGDELSGPEPGVHDLAIGHRARAGEIVLPVDRRDDTSLREAMLPQQPAVGAVKGLNHERDIRGAFGVARWSGPFKLTPRSSDRALSDLRGEEDTVAPHDRGRAAEARQRSLPRHARLARPAGGQPLLARDAAGLGASPLRPVLRAGDPRRKREHRNKDEGVSHPVIR